MIVTLHFSGSHCFVVLNFTKSGSQLCSRIPQSASRVETVQLTAAAKRCHRRSNSFTHQTSTKSTWTHRRVNDSLLSWISMAFYGIDAVRWLKWGASDTLFSGQLLFCTPAHVLYKYWNSDIDESSFGVVHLNTAVLILGGWIFFLV